MKPTLPKRALVISGGGSKGAFGGGIAEYLIDHCQYHYDLFIGTSAGSLLVPFLAMCEVARIKKVYTSIRQKDIFNICPFIIKKHNNHFTFRINHFNTLRMFLQGKRTFGESLNLRKLIRRTFTEADFHRLRQSGVEVLVTVSNLSCNSVEYQSIHHNSYEDFCDWMWASANVVPFMSLHSKDGMEYADGGFGNYLPLQEALRRGACEVDAIILQPRERDLKCQLPVKNPFALLLRTYDFMLEQISLDDLDLGRLEGLHRHATINCYHTPRLLTENSFIFDPGQMSAWWEEGYQYATATAPNCKLVAGSH